MCTILVRSMVSLSTYPSIEHGAENLFCTGVFVFGLLSLGSGFLKNGIIFLIFRATIGIGKCSQKFAGVST